MKQVTIKKAENGFVVSVPTPTPDPMTGPTEYVFSAWAEVTTFLTEQGLIPGAE